MVSHQQSAIPHWFMVECLKLIASKPRTTDFVRGFGALLLQGGRNIHPRAYARGVLWYGINHEHRITG